MSSHSAQLTPSPASLPMSPMPMTSAVNGHLTASSVPGTSMQLQTHSLAQPIAIGSMPAGSSQGLSSHWAASNMFPSGQLTPASFPTVQPMNFSRLSTSEPPTTIDEQSSYQGQEGQAPDKRRKRRESHNAVERRRRDTINEKIHELSVLLPDLVAEMNNGGPRPNKGMILRRSVDYIRHTQQLMQRQEERNKELIQTIKRLMQETGKTEDQLGLSMPLDSNIVNCDILIPAPLMVSPTSISNIKCSQEFDEVSLYPATQNAGPLSANASLLPSGALSMAHAGHLMYGNQESSMPASMPIPPSSMMFLKPGEAPILDPSMAAALNAAECVPSLNSIDMKVYERYLQKFDDEEMDEFGDVQ